MLISKYILPGKNCFNSPFLSIDNTTEVSHSKDLFCINSAYDFVKKNNIKIIIDYAHTPEALKTCLLNLREQFPDKKLCLLFGCGGNRDQNKRSKMGKIASDFSDKIYLTDDNPRHEKPSKIRKDIKKGIKIKKNH